ncbi:hypothetical protein EFO70_13925 [Lacticaseibacillus rhamnosus]|nr:hypothetical protein [Lacticaseibacillus rhamnosus]MCT3182545.1 hypothetical protein [Lacticaseibacillus rhamnosus]PTM25144.1 hypothetical protein DA801_06690 [Lacticaseibacillus rhamnosus]
MRGFKARPWSKAEKPTPLKTNFTTEPATAPPALAFYSSWSYHPVYRPTERKFTLTTIGCSASALTTNLLLRLF